MRLPTQLLLRKPDSNKGDYGHIFVLAGSSRFSGAAVLCASAALRAGAGLVTLGLPKGLNSAIIRIKLKEVMTLPLAQTRSGTLSLSAYRGIKDFLKQIDILAIGPGLGRDDSTQRLIRKIVRENVGPMVIDADALFALAGHLKLLAQTPNACPSDRRARRQTILTPHPGEMARLLGISVSKVQSNRKEIAKKFSKEHKLTLVLKGHKTIVSDAAGNLYINQTGNPGMATAGSGDVLTGIIAAFLGQGLSAFEAAKYAVYLHGLAGDLAAKEKTQMGMIASDIINKIPEAINKSS